MQAAIDRYFAKCDARILPTVVRVGKEAQVVDLPSPEPYTMSGLAYELEISRWTLIGYKDRCDEFGNEFLPTIRRARERVERDLERRLYDGVGSDKGLMFGLKNNFDWRDRQEIEHSGNVSVHFDKEDEKL